MTAARPDTWMPIYWGDYARDTGHLSATMHGAYLMLIKHYWSTGEALVDDDAQLWRVACCDSIGAWRKIRPIIEKFFRLDGERWHHGRVEKELRRSLDITEERSKAGAIGAAKRWQAHSKRIAEPSISQWQNDTPSQSQSHKEEDPPASLPPKGEALPKPRGSRLPSDFEVPSEWISEGAELRERHGLPPADLDTEAARFPLYWTAVAGAKGTKIDWRKTWLNRCLDIKGSTNGQLQAGRKFTPAESLYAGAALAVAEREAQRQHDRGEGDDVAEPLLDGSGRSGGQEIADPRLAGRPLRISGRVGGGGVPGMAPVTIEASADLEYPRVVHSAPRG